MYQNEQTTLNARDIERRKAEAYINEYQNSAALTNSPATADYKKYLTKSLINRGFLFNNLDNVERIYKASMEELFSNEFKNIFLYAKDRDIKNIYKDIENVKNMGPIGIFDLFSSLVTGINAKYLPTFESFKFEVPSSEVILSKMSYDEKIAIINAREDVEMGDDIVLYQYAKISEDDLVEGPVEGTRYFVAVDDLMSAVVRFEEVNNLEEFDLDTEYFTRSVREVMHVFNLPISAIHVNGHDFDSNLDLSLVDCENQEFVDSIQIEYDLSSVEFTDEELLPFVKKLVTEKVDHKFAYYLMEFLVSIKEIFLKYDIYKIISSVNFENQDSYVKTVIGITYCKALHVFATLAYAVNVSDYLNDNSVVKTLINDHIARSLKNVTVLKEMFSTADYFSEKVFDKMLLDGNLKNATHGRYKISSPVSDEIDYKEINTTVDKITCILVENIIKLRFMLERIDVVTYTDNSTLLALFLMSFVIMIQIIYNSAYLSKHKTLVIKSVREIFQHFGIVYDKIISEKELSEFIKIIED